MAKLALAAGRVAALAAQVASGRTTVMVHSAQSVIGIAQAGVTSVIADPVDWVDATLNAARKGSILAIALGNDGIPRIFAKDGFTAAARASHIGIELLSSGTIENGKCGYKR